MDPQGERAPLTLHRSVLWSMPPKMSSMTESCHVRAYAQASSACSTSLPLLSSCRYCAHTQEHAQHTCELCMRSLASGTATRRGNSKPIS